MQIVTPHKQEPQLHEHVRKMKYMFKKTNTQEAGRPWSRGREEDYILQLGPGGGGEAVGYRLDLGDEENLAVGDMLDGQMARARSSFLTC